MATKKIKTYKSIVEYLEKNDPVIATLLKDTCADYSLNIKGKQGITFLVPKDASFRAKLNDLAYSDNTDDVNKACDMLNALIIPDILKSTIDWMNKRDDIPNSLRQAIEVDGISGRDIKLKNNARVSLEPKFVDGSKKQNLSIWNLSGGEIPTDGKPSQFKYAQKTKGKKTKSGGVSVSNNNPISGLRKQIAIEVENAYMFDRIGRTMGGSRKYSGDSSHSSEKKERDIYLEYTLNLINFIVNVKGDLALFYGRILPLVSFQKVDFYNFIEPHKNCGQYIVPDYVINEWYSVKNSHNFNMQKIIDQIGEHLTIAGKTEQVKCYSDRMAILTAIDSSRMKIMQSSQTRPREIVDHIGKVYDDLSTNNRIDGLTNIYPPDLANIYASEKGLKLMQDELRFLTFLMFETLENSGYFERSRFEEIIGMISDYMYSQSSEDRERVLKLLNKNTIKYLISPTEKVNEIRIFVNSTYFLYIPLSPNEIANFPHKHTVVRPDPNNLTIYNINKAVFLKHKRLMDPQRTGNNDQKTLTELLALAEQDPKKLDPSVLATIKAIASRIT